MSSSPTGNVTKPGDVGKCPHCSEKLRFEDALYGISPRGVAGGYQGHSSTYDCFVHGAREIVQVFAVGCPGCGKPVISIGGKSEQWSAYPAYPRSPLRPVPAEVRAEDKSVTGDYEEAALLLSLSPKASATLGRRCLQTLLVKKAGAKPDDFLNTQIDGVLKSKALPEYIAENLDAIRHYGNFSVHPMFTKVGEIVDVEPGEAEWTLGILDDLFDHYYVKPQRAAKRRDDLNKKLKEVGKPPMKS
jgi:hypothetical protein